MDPEQIETQDIGEERKAFLEHRASGIGATDTPKILGLSKWGTPLSVYTDKVTPPSTDEMSLPAWLGLRLQATVAELYTTATGIRLRADNRHHRHGAYPWMVCHLDYRAWGRPDLLVECKTRAYMTGFGEDGSAVVPPDIWAQVQHEMAVTGATEAHVAVLFGHHTYRTYVIKRDAEFIDAAIPKLERFWFDNVVAGIPPEPGGSYVDSAIVKQTYADHDDSLIPATPEEERLIEAYALSTYNVIQAGIAKEEAANRLKTRIGEHAGITGVAGTVTWKRSKDSTLTDWVLVAAALRQAIEDARTKRLSARFLKALDMDAIEGLFTRTEQGSRRIHFKGGKA